MTADWVSRTLSALALLGVVVVWASIPDAHDPAEVLAHELLPPSTHEPCPMPPEADPGDLGDVMEVGISPLMSKLSFLLNHDDQSSPESKREAMVQTTARLLGCVQLASGNRPASRGELDRRYVEMMIDLRDSVALLQLTAVEDDWRSSQHWYDHTRKQCARCHLLYKSGSSE